MTHRPPARERPQRSRVLMLACSLAIHGALWWIASRTPPEPPPPPAREAVTVEVREKPPEPAPAAEPPPPTPPTTAPPATRRPPPVSLRPPADRPLATATPPEPSTPDAPPEDRRTEPPAVDRPTEPPRVERPVEKPAEKPVEKPVEKPPAGSPEPSAEPPSSEPPSAPPSSPGAPAVAEKPSDAGSTGPIRVAPDGQRAPPRGLNLLDPAVIGRSIRPADKGSGAGDRTDAPPSDSPTPRGQGPLVRSGGPPGTIGAEHARVSTRVRDQLEEAVAGANVSAGFISACDDGLDNNIDGEIDCADPGCRALSICDTTEVYEDRQPVGIPDEGGTVARSLASHQEGRVRKLSIRVDVLHARAGDLSLTLVAPNGRRAPLRPPDSDQPFKRAYYVRSFIGLPASGAWTLEVEDTVSGVRGALRGWRLYITS